jgi:hypothetical protein
MRFALRSKAVANVEDVKANLIKSRRIVFTPSVDLKTELANTSVQITCYDRNGNIVKRVTSDAGEVEDGDDEGGENTGDENTGGNTGDNGGNNGGGGGTLVDDPDGD